jgi:hypothetical protein
MNIELDEVVGQDVSDDALELAAGGRALGPTHVGTRVSKFLRASGLVNSCTCT